MLKRISSPAAQARAPFRRDAEPGRVAAMALTLSLHAVFVAWLLRERPVPVDDGPEDTVITVTFIARPSPAARVTKPRVRVASRTSVGTATPGDAAASVSSAQAHSVPVASATHQRAEDTPAPPAPLNVVIEEPAMDFRQDPLRRPDGRWEASEPRMRLTLTDRSLGGRLQAMQRRRMCGDLRAALSANRGSTEAILASMARHGCRG